MPLLPLATLFFYLPPYTPHLNAVESVFSSMRKHIRQQVVQEKTLGGHVLNGIRRTTATKARGWIQEANSNLALAIHGRRLGRLYDVRQVLPERYQDPYVESWDDEHEEEKEEEAEEYAEEWDDGHEEEEKGEELSDEGDSQDDEVGAMVAPAPLHAKVEREYSPSRNRSGRIRG